MIRFIAYSEYDSSGSSSAVVTKPANTADNDIMFAMVQRRSSLPSTLPPGWIKISEKNPYSDYYFGLYYKIAKSEGTDYTFSFSVGDRTRVTIATYRGGFNPYNPISVISDQTDVQAVQSVKAFSMNVPYKNSPILFFGGVYYTSAVTFTPPTIPVNFTENVDDGSTAADFWTTFAHTTWLNAKGATGDMISGLSTNSYITKQAFAVALNPLKNHSSALEGCMADYAMNGSQDESTNNNPFTATNVTYTNIDSKQGNCSYFNGANAYVDCGNDDSLKLSNEMTFSFWFKPTQIGVGAILYKAQEYLIIQDYGDIIFRLWDGTDWETGVLYTIPQLNKWYHVVCTHSISAGVATKKIYINGVLISQNTQTGTFTPTSNNMRIGQAWYTGEYFNGYIDQLMIWNRVLSFDEIKFIYELPKSLHNGMVSYWKLDGNSYDFVGKNDGIDTAITYGASYGKIGQGALFNGTSSKIIIPPINPNEFTISAWIKCSSFSATYTIIGDGTTNGGTLQFRTNGNSLNFIKSYVGGGAYSTSNLLINNAWNHCVLTYNQTTGVYSFYINGNKAGNGTLSSIITFNLYKLSIGSNNETEYMNGSIDEIAIWNRALTGEEIQQLFYAGNGNQYPLQTNMADMM